MLTKKFNSVLQFDTIKVDGQNKVQPVQWREFKKSESTKRKIKEAGLENEIDDTVDVEANYNLRKIVGYGATSVVFKAHKFDSVSEAIGAAGPGGDMIELEEKESSADKKCEVVAIKKIKNIFENDIYAHRILRELRLLRILKGHRNIMSVKSIMRPKDPANFKSLNLVAEYCTQNLMNVIRYNADTLKADQIKYLSFEILKGINFMHSKGIIHRDLKPLNVLVTQDWDVKISDFGQSNVQTGSINQDYNLTKYVTTRYYRAPELYLNYSSNYGPGVDMWAFGCIIAEFFTKKVFVKAATSEDYLKHMLEILGMPNRNIQSQIRNAKFLSYLKQNEAHVKRKAWQAMIPNAPPDALDLLGKLFTWDPSQRLTAKQVMRHPFYAELYDPKTDESIKDGTPVSYFDFEFEQYTINSKILRELLLDEIILSNSKEARAYNRAQRDLHPTGVLETIYQRQDTQTVVAQEKKGNDFQVSISVRKIQGSPDSQEETKESDKSSPVKIKPDSHLHIPGSPTKRLGAGSSHSRQSSRSGRAPS